MKVKREKHRAAIALPGAFFDVCGEEPPHVGLHAGGRRARGGAKFGGWNVKILLPGTEAQGFAGSGEQREAAAGRAENREPSWKVELR